MNPAVIVEVLSERTEAYDRGKKFEHYATIPDLSAYVLIATDRRAIELRERAGEVWTLRTFGPGDSVVLRAIGVELAVDEYEGIALTTSE